MHFEAKKNADKENMELRKLLKKDLEAYGKLRSQILRQEMERMVPGALHSARTVASGTAESASLESAVGSRNHDGN